LLTCLVRDIVHKNRGMNPYHYLSILLRSRPQHRRFCFAQY
jgi:hypothetical protein